MAKWLYKVSLDTPNIMESGSTLSHVKTTYDETEAVALLNDGRNRLERICKADGKTITEFYENNQWISDCCY